jgi:hypothetical protein
MKPDFEIDDHGVKIWRHNGLIHRLDGPAVEYVNGTKMWYEHGYEHREDGPAIEYPSGLVYWRLNGANIKPDEVIDDPNFCERYPALVKSMLIHLIHNS